MTEYTIAAIPTRYRGTMYRSRLEARWAAFFDRLGWAHQYEPFDLGSWSPDFLLTDLDVLVEVKPITSFDQDVSRKIGCFNRLVLMTYVSPQRLGEHEHVIGAIQRPKQIDFEHNSIPWDAAMIGWVRREHEPMLQAGIYVRPADKPIWVAAADLAGSATNRCFFYADHAARLWADACNAVQWEPRS
jgi:hypothetical protein